MIVAHLLPLFTKWPLHVFWKLILSPSKEGTVVAVTCYATGAMTDEYSTFYRKLRTSSSYIDSAADLYRCHPSWQPRTVLHPRSFRTRRNRLRLRCSDYGVRSLAHVLWCQPVKCALGSARCFVCIFVIS